MNLRNKQIKHKSFGVGTVVEQTDSTITVQFSSGNKKFMFPDAIGTHLVLVDQETAEQVDEMIREIEQERREKELELEKARAIEYEKQQRTMELKKLMKERKISPASQVAFWCEEEELEEVFSEWKVFTGVKKSGASKGEPNRLARLHKNSACLITVRDFEEPEEGRRILGVFMVNETFVGSSEDGYIPAHSEYRLCLSEEESRKMLFWRYYQNKRYPRNITWNSGRTRYFENVWMAQILKEIVSLKKESEDLELAKNFLEYFCKMNLIEEIPEPSGPLTSERENEELAISN